MAKGFSASTIKSWFQYRCERKVRYELSSDLELAAIPVVRDVREQAWSILGQQYEDRVIRRLCREASVLVPAAGTDALGEAETIDFLRGLNRATFATQVNLRPRRAPAFLDGTNLKLNRNLADLVQRISSDGGRSMLRVIDIKATRRATAFHKAQVAFYAMVLAERLAEVSPDPGQRATMDLFGEVWRIPDTGDVEGDDWQVERFALAPYVRLVEDFCRGKLRDIAATVVAPGHDGTFFHLYFKCEQCSFLGHCIKAIDPGIPPEQRDVSAVPGLTHEAKRTLLGLQIRSVSGLSRAAGLARTQGLGWSLERRAPLLNARASALASGQIERTQEEHTFLMPPRADALLLLSVDHDPVDDRIAALGYRRVQDGVVVSERIEVPTSGSIEHEAQTLVSVLSALIGDLSEIDEANAAGGNIYSHIFFFEPAEAINLQKAVGRHLDDDLVRGGLLHLVRLFPPEEVVPEPEFRGVHHLPATAVKNVVEQLWALPVAVSYDLRQVSLALEALGGGPGYRPAAAFARPFSSLLSIDVIRSHRSGEGKAIGADAIVADVAARLDALRGIVKWILEEDRRATLDGRALLRLAKKPFRFQATIDPLNAVDLDVLSACEILENRAGLLEALVGLAQPAARRQDARRCIAGMTLKNHWDYGRMRVLSFHVPHGGRDSDLSPADIGLILSDDDPDLRLDPSSWVGIACQIRPPDDGWEDRRDTLQVAVRRDVFTGPAFQDLMRRTGDGRWHLDRSFMDFNSMRCAAFLANLAQADAA